MKIIFIVIIVAILVGIGIFVFEYFFYDDYLFDDYYDDEYDDEYDDDYDEYDDYDKPSSDDEDIPEHTQLSSLPQLTVLINFRDQELDTDESDWEDFYFGRSDSVAAYFDEMSKGTFAIVPAKESYGEKNNGIVIITLDRKHPNLTPESSDKDYDVCSDIFVEMLDAVDKYIDFSDYDKNGDGEVLSNELSITMIAAGYEANEYSMDENQMAGIWISEDYFTEADGVNLAEYIICGELDMDENGRSDIVTIGVACHETAHVLGLPDLYDTDYSSIGLGFHALMSEGNNNRLPGERLGSTPSPMMAWSRIYVGFIQPQEVSKDGTYTLYGQSTDEYNVIKIDDGKGYYLIENIDFNEYGAGITEYMDHSGIAIWYIDDQVMTEDNIYYNEVMNNDRHRGITLIEAEGNDDLMEESLDYENPDYEHYFAKGYIDEYTTVNGTTIKVLTKPDAEMEIEITFDN
ncbi:MAG: M6 family metalloprotease domain-containing protein [Eubacteriales bacterium]